MAERPRTLASRRHWFRQVVAATSGSRQTVAAISYRFPSSSLLGSVRMVDSSAVMGHDALQQPSWPQAQRRASHRQHDGSQAYKVKDHRRRQGHGLPHGPHLVMLFSVSAVMAQRRLGSPEKSRSLSKRLSFTSSFFQLQRLSSERTQVRHRLSDTEQSSVIPAVRRPEQSVTISSFILDTALRQNISSKRHSSSGRANGTTGPPRRMGCAGSDNYSRVAALMSRIFRNSSSVPGRVRQETLSQRRTQPCNWTTTFAQKVAQWKTEQSASKALKVRHRCDHSRNSRN